MMTRTSAIRRVSDDFLDALRHGKSRVQRNGEIHVLGKALFHLRHQLLDAGSRVDCVGSGQLVGRNNRARLAVETSGNAVVLSAQFDASDVAHSHRRTIRRLANHDVAEFFRRHQAPLRENRIGKFLALRSGLASRFAGGVHGVL